MSAIENHAVAIALVALVAIVGGFFAYMPDVPVEPVAVPVATKVTRIGADGYISTSKRALVYASPTADWM